MRRWRQYFAELLNRLHNEEQETHDYYCPQQEIEKPTLLEVDITTGELRNNKAQGADNITAELIKYGGKELAEHTFKRSNSKHLGKRTDAEIFFCCGHLSDL
jgi:hypothetical protein